MADGEWAEVWDPNYSKYYYYNTITYECVWEKPEGFVSETQPDSSGALSGGNINEGLIKLRATMRIQRVFRAKKARARMRVRKAQAAAAAEKDLEDYPIVSVWSAVWDANYNQHYYYHAETQECVWDKPEDYAKAEEEALAKRAAAAEAREEEIKRKDEEERNKADNMAAALAAAVGEEGQPLLQEMDDDALIVVRERGACGKKVDCCVLCCRRCCSIPRAECQLPWVYTGRTDYGDTRDGRWGRRIMQVPPGPQMWLSQLRQEPEICVKSLFMPCVQFGTNETYLEGRNDAGYVCATCYVCCVPCAAPCCLGAWSRAKLRRALGVPPVPCWRDFCGHCFCPGCMLAQEGWAQKASGIAPNPAAMYRDPVLEEGAPAALKKYFSVKE